jgi:hypothetical protein
MTEARKRAIFDAVIEQIGSIQNFGACPLPEKSGNLSGDML